MIIPVGFAQVTHFFSGASAPNGAAVTYGISGFGTGTALEQAEALHDAFELRFKDFLVSTLALDSTRLKYGPNATGPFYEFTDRRFMAASGAGVPPNTAALVEKRTALGGRSGRGRMFIPGLQESNVETGGEISLGLYSLFNASLAAWLADIETLATNMVLFHNASSDPTIVDSLDLDPLTATQRRRLR